jgi:hypothetical protein
MQTRKTTKPKADQVIEDFDAFWAEHSAAPDRPMVRIRGELVPIPLDMPLDLAQRMESAGVADEAMMRELLGELYGADVLDRWTAAGMGAQEFLVLIAWSVARARGADVSFADVAEQLRTLPEGGAREGKAQAPAKPLPPLKRTRSGGTGGSSSRTLRVSTGTTRKR